MNNFILFLLRTILLANVSFGKNSNNGFEYLGKMFAYSNFKIYRFCTFTIDDYQKCQATINAAKSRSLDFPLRCILKDTRDDCISSVRRCLADFVVLTGHNYQIGREAGLKPAIFEHGSSEDVYIAVAPYNITVVDLDKAPIIVDQSNHRAIHAAIFFNLHRGHGICSLYTSASEENSIKIVNSAEYKENDEEILLCPDRSWAFFESYQECNFEASLQSAVFVENRMPAFVISRLKSFIFDVIAKEFSHRKLNQTQNEDHFDFFTTFNGKDNVIFKSDTIGFNLYPTYRNGFTEAISNSLHCNADAGDQDSSQLE